MSIIDDESVSNTSGNEHFQDIMDEPRLGTGSWPVASRLLQPCCSEVWKCWERRRPRRPGTWAKAF